MEQKNPKVQEKQSLVTRRCIKLIMMITNIGIALIVIGLGIYKYAVGNIETFSQAFVPFYLILFGTILICAELEWLFMVKYFKFLDNYFGRGLYNFFLATMVINSISETFSKTQDENTFYILIIILSSILASVGFFEIILYFLDCGGKSKKYEEHDKELQQNLIIKQNSTPQTPEIPPTVVVKNDNLVNINKMQTQDPQAYILWLQAQLATMKQKNPQMS